MSLSRTNEVGSQQTSGKFGNNNGVYLAYVKDNTDGQTMGRLKVWVPDFGTEENDVNGWRVVSYASPFGGATSYTGVGKDVNDGDQTQTSYGMWMIPPDVDNQVLVCFANGDPAHGYWFGCVFQQNMNSMVPSVPTETDYLTVAGMPRKYNSVPLPTSEYNKHTTSKVSQKPSRPVNKHRMRAIAAQGLIRDPIRGQSTSSAKRSSTSGVYGISTPGPTNPDSPNQKGRIGGHSLIMDDGEGSEHITLKTRSGAQLRIDETNGMIYLINKKGTGWIQIDDDGNGDIFCANDLSLRALRDFNIRADRDVNIEAGRNVAIKAAKDNIGAPGEGVGGSGSGSGGKVYVEAHDTLELSVIGDINANCANTSFTTEEMNVSSAGNINLEAALRLNLKATLGASLDGGLSTSMLGAAVNLDGAINLNAGASTPAEPASPTESTVKGSGTKEDNLNGFEDAEYEFDRLTQTFSTIVGRMPTLEPCPEHTDG